MQYKIGDNIIVEELFNESSDNDGYIEIDSSKFKGRELKYYQNNLQGKKVNNSVLGEIYLGKKGKMTNKFNDTTKLKDISGMFSGCTQLKEVVIGITNTGSVTNMTGLFKNCSGLEVMPDLRGWNMMKVEKYKGMFYGCQNKKLTQPKWMPTLRFKKGTNYDKIVENSKLDNQDLKNAWKNNEPKDEIN